MFTQQLGVELKHERLEPERIRRNEECRAERDARILTSNGCGLLLIGMHVALNGLLRSFATITNVKEFEGASWRAPPCDLHIICEHL